MYFIYSTIFCTAVIVLYFYTAFIVLYFLYCNYSTTFLLFSTVTNRMQQICISLDPSLALRGDILIKCYHKGARSSGRNRELVFRCQFHTCAISHNSLLFNKNDLDDACEGEEVEFLLFGVGGYCVLRLWLEGRGHCVFVVIYWKRTLCFCCLF